MMHRLIVVGGGNVGNVEQRLCRAASLIEERIGRISCQSATHISEAWGFASQQRFTNKAYAIDTELSPAEVLGVLHGIEEELGRDRMAEYRTKVLSGERYAERTIDLDIALYDKECIVTPHLSIPHVALLHRDFFVEPICEVMGCKREDLERLIKEIIEKI